MCITTEADERIPDEERGSKSIEEKLIVSVTDDVERLCCKSTDVLQWKKQEIVRRIH
jgi:hypothetical protein